jgi:hypothetical protein
VYLAIDFDVCDQAGLLLLTVVEIDVYMLRTIIQAM